MFYFIIFDAYCNFYSVINFMIFLSFYGAFCNVFFAFIAQF